MTTSPKDNQRHTDVIWERPEPRAHRRPLSRDAIVRVAMKSADRDGIESVSLRKVAALLDTTPVRLYSYLSTKEELLGLMGDAVFGEILPIGSEYCEDWRDALRAIARRTRQIALKHLWFIDLVSGPPRLGPNALNYFESSYAVLASRPGFGDMDAIMQAVGAVNAYVAGAIRNEVSALRIRKESGDNATSWQADFWPYLQKMIATGRMPMLARVVHEATHPSADTTFDRGLDYILDGIAAHIGQSYARVV